MERPPLTLCRPRPYVLLWLGLLLALVTWSSGRPHRRAEKCGCMMLLLLALVALSGRALPA